jgi:hypothetical protein
MDKLQGEETNYRNQKGRRLQSLHFPISKRQSRKDEKQYTHELDNLEELGLSLASPKDHISRITKQIM